MGRAGIPEVYARLLGRAVSRKTDLRTLFREEYRCALEQLRYLNPQDYKAALAGPAGLVVSPNAMIECGWQSFVSGEYGLRLRVPWIPSILREGKLTRTIKSLATDLNADDPGWRNRLRGAVDALERLRAPSVASRVTRHSRHPGPNSQAPSFGIGPARGHGEEPARPQTVLKVSSPPPEWNTGARIQRTSQTADQSGASAFRSSLNLRESPKREFLPNSPPM